MKQLRRWLSQPKTILIALFLISVVVFALTAYNSRFRINPDGISYISIAQQYANGHFDTAPNSLYPPLISWLMVPFLKLGLAGQTAFMAVNGFIAVLTLLVSSYTVWRQTRRNLKAVVWFWVIAMPFLAHGIGSHITPDLLTVAWMAVFILAAIKAEELVRLGARRNHLKAATLLGLVGTFGYLTKQYLIPVFVVSLIVWFSIRYFALGRKPAGWRGWAATYKVPALALGVMAITSAPWVAVISAQSGKFTISTAFTYNLANKFKSTKTTTTASGEVKVLHKPALIPPPNPYAYSYNECPQCPTSYRSPKRAKINFNGSQGIRYYMSQRVRAFPMYLNKIRETWLFILPIMVALAVVWARRKINFKQNSDIILAGIGLSVYFAGFVPIVGTALKGGNVRYYWPMLLAAALIAAISLPKLWLRVKKLRPQWLQCLSILVILVVPLLTLKQYRSVVSTALKPVKYPSRQVLADTIRSEGLIKAGDQLASNNKRQTQMLAFYLSAQSYGSIAPDGADNPTFDDPRVQKEFREFGIDYYLHYARNQDPKLKLAGSGGKIIRQFHFKRYGCANIRKAPSEDCTISIVKLPDYDKKDFNPKGN